MRIPFAVLTILICTVSSYAATTQRANPTILPSVFTDHMVVQRGLPVPVWGRAEPGTTVKITARYPSGDVATEAAADAQGAWSANLAALPATTKPFDVAISASDGTMLAIHDVLVGDVWVASGQSNMELQLRKAHNGADEVPKANHPEMRLFLIPRKSSPQPNFDCKASWAVCTPQSAMSFSAVAYFFGREIQRSENVPIGLIGTYAGGTKIQPWMSAQNELANTPQERSRATTQASSRPATPRFGSLYNAMVAPVVPYAIKGVIWYQGESNADEPEAYRRQFPALIADWRRQWNQPGDAGSLTRDFPFLFVQLANFVAYPNTDWPALREAQAMTLAASPNTALATTIDIGAVNDIHPKNKIEVGHRLALAAEHVAYAKQVVFSGPTFDRMLIENERSVLTFKHAGGGLCIAAAPTTRPNETPTPTDVLRGFEIAGADGEFAPADATIDGVDRVVVSSSQIAHPVAVRYGWANAPVVNLYNKEHLPAVPFRTKQ